MAISNCLFSPTFEIPAEFPTWCVLAKLSTKPRNSTHSRDRCTQYPKNAENRTTN